MKHWILNKFQDMIDDLVFKTLRGNHIYIDSLNIQIDDQVEIINDLLEERSKYLDMIEAMNYDIEMLKRRK